MRSHCVNVFRTCSFSRTGPRLLFCHTTTFGTQWNVNRDRFLNWILNCKTIFINCVHNGPVRPFVRRCKFVCSPNAAAAIVNPAPQDELRVGIFNLFLLSPIFFFQEQSISSWFNAENSGKTSERLVVMIQISSWYKSPQGASYFKTVSQWTANW